LNASGFAVSPVLGANPVGFQTDVRLGTGAEYQGDGTDLVLLHQIDTDWESVDFTYESATRSILAAGVSESSAYVLAKANRPQVEITRGLDGFGGPLTKAAFYAIPGYKYTLERSVDLVHWDEVASQSPLIAGKTALNYGDSVNAAFYRLRLTRF
jgi:hypothetical protein